LCAERRRLVETRRLIHTRLVKGRRPRPTEVGLRFLGVAGWLLKAPTRIAEVVAWLVELTALVEAATAPAEVAPTAAEVIRTFVDIRSRTELWSRRQIAAARPIVVVWAVTM
jgi:hypothetical protein